MKLLELFSGTGSWNKYCLENNIECVSVDISKKYHTPTILIDIMEWDYKSAFSPNHFDIITASPPCQYFSCLQRWGKYKKSPTTIKNNIEKYALPVLKRTLEIIEYFNPTYYFIENPLTGAMKDYMDSKYKFIKVDYCRFDYNYKKPTIIYTNKNLLDCRCLHKGKKHIQHLGTQFDKTTLAERYSIPPKLLYYLME